MAILLCTIATTPAFSSAASERVDEFHASLLAVLKSGDRQPLKERYERLAPRIHSIFDIPLMMQAMTGRRWLHATEEERANLVHSYTRLSILIYASRLDAYTGERFETIGEQEGPEGRLLVLTRLVRPNANPIPITYVMEKAAGGGRVVDIILGGAVSEVQLRRSEYRNILDQGGITALTQRLNETAERILAQPPRSMTSQ